MEYDGIMKFLRGWPKRIMTLVGMIILLVMVMDLNARMVHMYRLRGERDKELARVEELETTEAELDLKIEYAKSDDIVAQWAREQNWMQREGDFVIALIGTGDPPPEVITEPFQSTPDLENWEAWRLWLTFRE